MKRSAEKEMMDLPGNPRDLLVDDLRNLRTINRYFGGYRGVLKGLKQLVGKDKMSSFSLLDVGTGSADIPRVIVQWARSEGIHAKVVGLEPDAVTAEEAATPTPNEASSPFIPLWQRGKEGDFPHSAISVVRGDGNAPPFRAASFDFVLASQVLHHFPEETIVALLRTWSQLVRRSIIVSDLVRHPVAYYGIRLVTKLFTRNAMTLTDAPLSVQRAFTMAEWHELFRRAEIGPFQIFSVFPYRVLALVSTKR